MTKIDKNRFVIQNGKLFIDGLLSDVPDTIFVSVIDTGENGAVFNAIDMLDREVAVKIWIQSRKYSEDTYDQGLNEAKKLAKLEHPNILQVFSAGTDKNNRFYSVMKRLGGPTLKTYLSDTKPLEERYTLWFDIARAIHFAHSNGIYHGDLHFGNIAVENGRAKVFDFGASMSETNRSVFRQIESGQLEFISEAMFPEFDKIILLPINNPFYNNPELVLCRAIAWISFEGHYLALKQTIKYHPDDDYMKDYFVYGTAILMGQAPVFNIDKVLERFSLLPHSGEDNQLSVKLFIASLFAQCNRKLLGHNSCEEIPARKDLETLKIMTLDAWNKWQSKFLSMDYKDFSKVADDFFPLMDINEPVHLPVRWAEPID